MRAVFLSDAHLAGPDDPRQRAFLRFVEGLDADHLVLGGDVFQHWWHFGDAPFSAYAEVVDALAARGLPLTVLPGNHDFHAPAFFARRGATVPTGPDGAVVHRWGGRSVYLHHGDAADVSWGYAATCALLRGPVFRALVDALGAERAWPFLGRLGGSGRVTPNPPLIAAQEHLAGSLLEEHDVVVFGHTHAPREVRAGRGLYVNAGEFPRTWVVIDDGEARLVGEGAARG